MPSLHQGGAERLLSDLVTGTESAVTHRIVALTDDPPFFPTGAAQLSSLGLKRGRFSVAAARRLRAELRAYRPDLVHAWLYHGNAASLLAYGLRVPILWSIHNTDLSPNGSKWLTRVINRGCALLSRQVPARILYCAQTARIIHESLGYDSSAGLVIENGVDLRRFAFDPEARRRHRADLSAAGEEVLIGCIGRFDLQKDHATVIEAFAHLRRDVRGKLVLVGSGCNADNPQLVSLLETAGVLADTSLLGERTDIPALLSALDLLVIGSAFGEAFPMVALEGAAAGLPLVTTNVGEARLLALDASAVVPPRDPGALAAAMSHVCGLRGADALAELKRRRHKLLEERFDIGAVRRRYLQLYAALADGAR
jgi:glycosyltransferase involved in cell wall biosynthesis